LKQQQKSSIRFGIRMMIILIVLTATMTYTIGCNGSHPGDNADTFTDKAVTDKVVISPVDTSAWTKKDSVKWAGNDPGKWPSKFGFGKIASTNEISRIDIDIMPDGTGLPRGAGFANRGREIYLVKCASCHGRTGREGPNSKLVGPMGDTTKDKTIGNYWPYATTIFDYIRRAMPYNAPGSLTNQEVYHLTAFLLYENKIIDSAASINASSLVRIRMPAQKYYVNDDRHGGPEVR